MKLPNPKTVRLGVTFIGLVTVATVLQGQNPNAPGPLHNRIPLPEDWSHRHLIYSSPSTFGQGLQIQQRHRFWQQWFRRNAHVETQDDGAFSSQFRERHHGNDPQDEFQRDWGISMGAGATVGEGMYPAKFTFDINATPSCAGDYLVFNTSLSGSAALNIVAFNNLYAGTGGLCSTGPSVLFAYQTKTDGGTSGTFTSPTLSLDGTQVAYMEGRGGGTGVLHILRWKAGDGGTVAAPVLVTTSVTTGASYVTCKSTATSCLVSLVFGNGVGSSSSEPFYDFDTDDLYVGDDNGNLHKFTGVFKGTPAEVTAGGWPMTVHSGHALTGPVADNTSGNIFVNDVDGTLSYVKEAGSTVGTCGTGVPPCLGSTTVAVTTNNKSITDPPIVDSAQGRVFAFTGNNSSGTLGGANVVQADTALSAASVVRLDVGIGQNFNLHDGDFDNAYYTSVGTGHIYVCANSGANSGSASGAVADNQPTLKRISFNSNGTMNAVDAGTLAVATTSTTCSPVTEILNGGTDWIFFSVQSSGSPTACFGLGCVMSVSVPTASPFTFPPSVSAALPESGGTSGIVIDNVSTAGQASSIYFSILSNSGPPHATCNGPGGTNNVGCAVKATQSGLN
jgi:hypothetical protein